MPPIVPERGRPHEQPEETARHGRLGFRPAPPVALSDRSGLVVFDDDGGAGVGLAYVPPTAGEEPLRLIVVLHGAGGTARQGLDLLLPLADEHRLLLVAPSSARSTWDVIVDGYGPDVRRIDRLLDEVAARHRIEALAVAGFSDGASYALSLAIANGDVLDAAIAFSPGFTAPLVTHGRPRLFIAHGRRDAVLPIERCSRRLVPQLEADGYAVTYEEFDDGHVIPPALVARAGAWLAG